MLRAPHGAATRPTSEKVREALFQILAHRVAIEGARVLDLFAGSGGLGIEALSRGAAHATFVDSARAPLLAIRGNLADLALADRAEVIAGDAVAIAARAVNAPYAIAFIDPPYASDLAVRAATALPRASLADDAVVVIEHDRRNAPPEALGNLLRTDQRRYGDTLISLYGKAPP